MGRPTKEDYEDTVKAVEAAGGNAAEAARRMGINPRTVRDRLAAAKARYGLELKISAPVEPPKDPVEVQAEKDQVKLLRSELAEANRRIRRLQNLRETAFELMEDVQIPTWTVPKVKFGEDPLTEVAMLFTSDFQAAEVVKPEQMDGWNEYNSEVFIESYRRMIEKTIKLCFEHTAHADYHGLIYLRGGDALNGEIHDNKETNDRTIIQAIKMVAQEEVRGIELLADAFGRVFVPSVPGNHGRTTIKPKSKDYADTNYEDLISWYIEGYFRAKGDTRVTFYTPRSGDAYFPVGCLRFLLTHGDTIGSSGGTGFIGPIAPISRGVKKIIEEYSAYERRIDWIMLGHYHQALQLQNCFVNGSLVGYNEFAKKHRMRPEPPSQWLLNIHPETGIITNQRRVWVRQLPKQSRLILPWEVEENGRTESR